MFWDEVEAKALKEARDLLQGQINHEFELQVGASRYERTARRRDERNGSRPRTYEIRTGFIADLRIPRARKLDIRFTVFDKWERVEPKVLGAILKAYLLSRSSTCAQEIVEAFGQSRFSRSFLQRLTHQFEERLKEFRERRLGNWPYVFIDGMGVKVWDTYLKDKVVIFAVGMDEEGRREVLGWVVSDSEDEMSVRGLLIDLKGRGLRSPELFISDESKGIMSGLKLEYPHAAWQSCAFHKVSGIQRSLEDISVRKEILREAGDIYELSESRREALKRFRRFCRRWKGREPRAVNLFARGFENTLSYFDFPRHMWVSLRTNNPMEQFIGKLRTWTARFNYFRGRANLNLAIFTYICHKSGDLVPECLHPESGNPEGVTRRKPTLFVA
ncbi:MAG: IS256 family transposase [Candidatus Eisenbacteria bacterium]